MDTGYVQHFNESQSKKFPTLITPKDLNIVVEKQYNNGLEMLKILQSLKFILHKIYPSEPRKSLVSVTKK